LLTSRQAWGSDRRVLTPDDLPTPDEHRERITMATAFRVAIAIIVGLALALGLVIAVEVASAIVHPVPADFNNTMEEMCAHVARIPNWVLALAAAAWSGTAFVSTWVASRIGNRGCGAFVGLLLLAAAAFNVAQLPYPIWFKAVVLISIPAAIYAGLRLCPRRESATASSIS
jgi:hypothetical protein